MKERPIIFSGPMVRAILDGRKTQTRRPMKPQPPSWIERVGYDAFCSEGFIAGRGTFEDKGPAEKFFRLPYGLTGDRLWVKETWQSLHNLGQKVSEFEDWQRGTSECFYLADESDPRNKPMSGKWRPSLFMPRWASRITLEIVGTRVERLNDISEHDAECEGFALSDRSKGTYVADFPSASGHFRTYWNEINGKRAPWDSNPWVWVIEFRNIAEKRR